MTATAQETLAAVKDVAARVRQAGGRALLVGGCVRDRLLSRTAEITDYDLEVFGLPQEALLRLLSAHYRLDCVGLSFGIIKLHRYAIDIALPRRETKLGLGHRAFETQTDPFLSLEEAAARRDFTVNALYCDPLTEEILDPWGGRRDLAAGVLRHVSDHFREDPLRVLRAMQFLARFSLSPAPETVAICRAMTPENLPRERLFEEWAKLLTKGVAISSGLRFLRETGWVAFYPELAALVGCAQNPQWHPEGDVWEHTLQCLDAFAAARDRQGRRPEEDLIVGFAVLCHDFGKPAATRYDARRRCVCSPGHDEAGVAPTEAFLRRLTDETRLLREVPPRVRLHMRPFSLWKGRGGEGAIRRLSAQVRIDRLLRVAAADDAGRAPFPSDPRHLDWLAAEAERLNVKDAAPAPLLLGRDLIARGLAPGVAFGRILRAAYDAQLEGVFRDRQGALAYLETIDEGGNFR
jgi:tRNA nucleotidyltransferase (CCA-adding enzyme)